MKSEDHDLAMQEMRKRYENESYADIRKEISETHKEWMGAEPFDSLKFEDRLDFNRIDYIKRFFPYDLEPLFEEGMFLMEMLEIYKDAQHPVVKNYKMFLEQKIEELIEGNVKDKIVDRDKEDLPSVELKTQKEQIRLLYDLGIIDFLIKKYPNTLKNNNSQIAILISKVLKQNKTSIQPSLSALLNDTVNKNYPKQTESIKSILDKLNSNELTY